MKTVTVTLLLLFVSFEGALTQVSNPDNELRHRMTMKSNVSAERTSGLSFGAGYVIPYTKHSKHGAGLDFFLNYTGNTSKKLAVRGGIGLQVAATDDQQDIAETEGSQVLLYAKAGTLYGQVGRNNAVNYYGFGELRAGLGMVDPITAVVASVGGDDKEAYFDIGLNLGGGVSFRMSGNSRFFLEPVVSFATKYNSFVFRAGLEF